MRSSSLVLLLSLFGLSTAVSSGQLLTGPVQGYIFDAPSRSFRAVLGFPGSASVGPPLSQGFDSGAVAPLKNYAIAFQKNRAEFVSGLGTGHVLVSSIAAVFPKPEGVAWSGDGSAAVIYSRTGNWLQLLTGFPAAASTCAGHSCVPAVVHSVDVSTMHATLSSVALDKNGTHVALGATGDHSGVYVSANRSPFALVLETSHPAALSFSDDASSLYALDESNSTLSSISLPNSSFQSHALTGLADPFALQFGRDATGRALVYIASRKNRIFRSYDPAGHRTVHDIALSFVPAAIDDLGARSFLLSPRKKEGDPLWVFSSTPKPAVYFVPVPADGGKGQ